MLVVRCCAHLFASLTCSLSLAVSRVVLSVTRSLIALPFLSLSLVLPLLLHPSLSGLLTFKELSLARDIATVALRRYVLPEGPDRLTRYDLAANGSLDRNLELLPRQDALKASAQVFTALMTLRAMYNHRECIDGFTVDQDVQTDQRPRMPSAEHVANRENQRERKSVPRALQAFGDR